MLILGLKACYSETGAAVNLSIKISGRCPIKIYRQQPTGASKQASWSETTALRSHLDFPALFWSSRAVVASLPRLFPPKGTAVLLPN